MAHKKHHPDQTHQHPPGKPNAQLVMFQGWSDGLEHRIELKPGTIGILEDHDTITNEPIVKYVVDNKTVEIWHTDSEIQLISPE